MEVTEDPYRLQCFQDRLAEGPLHLDQFVRLPYELFYDKNKKVLEQNYAWPGYGLLPEGRAPSLRARPYAHILDRYGECTLANAGHPRRPPMRRSTASIRPI